MLKPQDVLVVLRLLDAPKEEHTFPKLALSLDMSASETHAAVKRAERSGLLEPNTRKVRKAALLEFLVHGLRYVFPAVFSGITRGVPTAHAAPPLVNSFVADELPPVWPHPLGNVRGQGLEPLYKSVPASAMRNPQLHEWLALVDAVRAGRARERRLAVEELRKRLKS